MPARLAPRVAGAVSIVSLLAVWEVVVRAELVLSSFAPPPSVIVLTVVDLFVSGILWRQLTATLFRIAVGYAIAAVIGVLAAIACGLSRTVEHLLVPPVEFVRCIAPLALLPAFMLILGIGPVSKIAIIVWVAWVPIFINTLEGAKAVDPVLVKAAQSIGSSDLQIALKVVLPSALPFVVAGLRLGMGSAFLVLVAAEMLGTDAGLGFFILETSQTFKLREMYAAIFVVGVLGFLVNWAFTRLGRALMPWHVRTE